MPAAAGGRPGDGCAEGAGDGMPTRAAPFSFAAPLPRLPWPGVEAVAFFFASPLLSQRGRLGRLVRRVHLRQPPLEFSRATL
jgi:hypothetical protein